MAHFLFFVTAGVKAGDIELSLAILKRVKPAVADRCCFSFTPDNARKPTIFVV